MTRYCRIFFLLPFISLTGFSQEPVTYPAIGTSDLPDAVFEAPKTYTGASLYGYMDGGADLYLEYGLAGARIDEVTMTGRKYTIETYRMNGPEGAFGIYSVSRYQCKSAPPLAPFTCLTPYQLQIVAGPFYINIINSSGASADSAASLKIGEAIVRKVTDKPADISRFMPEIPMETINREAILVKGELGLRNGAPDLADYFEGMSGYCAVILQQTEQVLISVRFKDKEDTEAFTALHSPGQRSATASAADAGEETITRISENQLLIRIKNSGSREE